MARAVGVLQTLSFVAVWLLSIIRPSDAAGRVVELSPITMQSSVLQPLESISYSRTSGNFGETVKNNTQVSRISQSSSLLRLAKANLTDANFPGNETAKSTVQAAVMAELAAGTFIFDVNSTSVRQVARNASFLMDGPDPEIANGSVVPLGILLPFNATDAAVKRDSWVQLYSLLYGVQKEMLDNPELGHTVRVYATNTFDEIRPKSRAAVASQFLLKVGIVGAVGDSTPAKSEMIGSFFRILGLPFCSLQPQTFSERRLRRRMNARIVGANNVYQVDPVLDTRASTTAPQYRPFHNLDVDLAALYATLIAQNWVRVAVVMDESQDDGMYLWNSMVEAAGNHVVQITAQINVPLAWSEDEITSLCSDLHITQSMVVVSLISALDSTYLVRALDGCGFLTSDRILVSVNKPILEWPVPVPSAQLGNWAVRDSTSQGKVFLMNTNTAHNSTFSRIQDNDDVEAPQSVDDTNTNSTATMVLANSVQNPNANVVFLGALSSPFSDTMSLAAAKFTVMGFPDAEFPEFNTINTQTEQELLQSMGMEESITCGYTMIAGLNKFSNRANRTLTRTNVQTIQLSDFNNTFAEFILDPSTGDLHPKSMGVQVALLSNTSGTLERVRPLWGFNDNSMGSQRELALQAVPFTESSLTSGPPIMYGQQINDSPTRHVSNPLWGQTTTWIVVAFACFGNLIVVVCAVSVVMLRHTASVRASTPFSAIQICLGALMKINIVFLLIGIPTPTTCQVRTFMLYLGHALVYSAVLTKTYRIYKVFQARHVYSKVTVNTVIKWTGTIVMIESVLLLLYVYLAQPVPVLLVDDMDSEYYVCEATESMGSRIATMAIIAYNLIVTGSAGVLAFLTRNVYHRYNESQYLAFALFNDTLVITTLAALRFTPSLIGYTDSIFQVGCIYIGVFKVIILVSPAIYRGFVQTQFGHQRQMASIRSVDSSRQIRSSATESSATTPVRASNDFDERPFGGSVMTLPSRTLLSFLSRDSDELDESVTVQLDRLKMTDPVRTEEEVSRDVVWAPVATRVEFHKGWRSWTVARIVLGLGQQWRNATIIFANSDTSLRIHWGQRVLTATRNNTQAKYARRPPTDGAKSAVVEDAHEVVVHLITPTWAADISLNSQWEADVMVMFFETV